MKQLSEGKSIDVDPVEKEPTSKEIKEKEQEDLYDLLDQKENNENNPLDIKAKRVKLMQDLRKEENEEESESEMEEEIDQEEPAIDAESANEELV